MKNIQQTYVNHGRDFDIITRAEGEVVEKLSPGNYRLNFSPVRGWWFSQMQSFNLPDKLYGNVDRRTKRILDTYHARMKKNQATGVLLEGIKGSGKTLLAKRVASTSNLPVILINFPYVSDDFKEILANVGPCVVIFDEFEKVYHELEKQNAVLTLLDGVFSSQVLTFVIVNDTNKLVGPLKNRPGRLFYSLEYGGLSEEFIKEYVADRLAPSMVNICNGFGEPKGQEVDEEASEKKVQGILSVAAMFRHFTFDHLQAVVEEMNRYGEPAEDVIEFLNVKIPKPSAFDMYEVRIWVDGKDLTSIQKSSFTVQHSVPVYQTSYLHYRDGTTECEEAHPGDDMIKDLDDSDDLHEVYLSIGPRNLVKTDIKTQSFTFMADSNDSVKLVYTKASAERQMELMKRTVF